MGCRSQPGGRGGRRYGSAHLGRQSRYHSAILHHRSSACHHHDNARYDRGLNDDCAGARPHDHHHSAGSHHDYPAAEHFNFHLDFDLEHDVDLSSPVHDDRGEWRGQRASHLHISLGRARARRGVHHPHDRADDSSPHCRLA